MGISFQYKDKPTEELYGNSAIEESGDFSSEKELKNTIKNIFKNYQCPSCGGHKMDGDNVIVEKGKVKFFKEVKKDGFFGSKYVNTHDRDVWRVYNIYLKPSGFLSFAGYIKCKSCGWEEKGQKGVRWLSINDIQNGNF
jgi:predicted nucleic-acid-binding Zn-ribbon protein